MAPTVMAATVPSHLNAHPSTAPQTTTVQKIVHLKAVETTTTAAIVAQRILSALQDTATLLTVNAILNALPIKFMVNIRTVATAKMMPSADPDIVPIILANQLALTLTAWATTSMVATAR
jgi:hypothetical protein